jgi:tetratricopeptide (TPR) repeat protein
MEEVVRIIDEAITKSERKDCFNYRQELKDRITEGETKDSIQVVINVLSYHMNLKNPKQPFEPYAIFGGKRTAALEDLTQFELTFLGDIYSKISDSEFKARIGDVIWTIDKQYKLGIEAIDLYLMAANKLEDWDHWPSCYDRIKRALQLAMSLGKNNGKLDEVNDYIKTLILNINGEDPLFLTGRLIELLIDQKDVDIKPFIEIIEKKIERNTNLNEFNQSRYYLELKNKCFKKLGLKQQAEETVKRIANSYEVEVGVLKEKGSDNYLLMIKHLEDAIKTYRTVSGMKKKIDKLLIEMEPYKKKVSENLKEFSYQTDISHIVKEIEKSFKKINKLESIYKLAYIKRIVPKRNLREQVEKRISPLDFIASTEMIDNNGRRIVNMPDLLSGTEEEKEKAFDAYMLQEAANNHSYTGSILIGNALRIIREEHEISRSDLENIVRDNLFIPKGRELIYRDGLFEGFQGNFLTAIHILIPQLENSFREFARLCGDLVTTFEDDGKEQVKSLNSIFELPKFIDAYDEDLIFDLRSLLTEKYGSNIRNKLAHGLLTYEEASSSIAVYVWWISLRLCCMYSKVPLQT